MTFATPDFYIELLYMSSVTETTQIIPNPAPSSLDNSVFTSADNSVTSPTGVITKGGRKTRAKKAMKKRRATKSRSTKKCWWKFF